MWVLAACLLVISAVTVTDARHGCTTCPSNACSQSEAHIGFCKDELYVSEGYQCSYDGSQQTSRRTYYGCGFFNLGRCSRDVTYYVSVTRYQTCYRSRRNCHRRCCSGFQSSGGNCLPYCSGGCHNGGVCVDPEVCDCPSNWHGQYCNVDVNECELSNGGCSDYCSNNPGSYSCDCRQYADLDPDGRHCTCRPGFIQNDDTVTCDGVNPCDVNNGGCSDNCSNNPGSYSCDCREYADLDPDGRHCTCRPGFIQNDTHKTCDDIDECADNYGECDHYCINTPGSYSCDCKTGYKLYGLKKCLLTCTGGCLNGGECVKPGECNCSTGWTGQNCESDVNECNGTDNGGCNQICSNTPGSYNCSCNEGYTMLGESNICTEIQTSPAEEYYTSGVAAVSGGAVFVIIAGLVLCVVVALVVKLRGTFCHKKAKDKTQDTEPPPEDYGGFELTPNPAYGEVSYVKSDKSQNGGAHPVHDDEGGNVYVSTDREPPAYENIEMLY